MDSRRSFWRTDSAPGLGEPLELREVAVEMRAHGLLSARVTLVVDAHGDSRAHGAEVGKRDQAALLDARFSADVLGQTAALWS